MTKSTGFQLLATLFVACYKGPTLPIFTKLLRVGEKMGFPSEVLEVMSVDALGLIMFVIVWAPLCFKVEYKEVIVLVVRQEIVN